LKTSLLLFCVAAVAAGQSGNYRFAHLTVSNGAAKTVSGALRVDDKIPRRGPALLAPGGVELYGTNESPVIVGASPTPGVFDLWVGVRTGDTPPTLKGNYAGGLLQFHNGKVDGMTSGYLEFTADGEGALSQISMVAHAAYIDDVNRRFTAEAGTYKIAANGNGTLEFPATFGYAAGVKDMLVSAGGEVLVGVPRNPAAGLFVMVSRAPDTSTISWNGVFHIAELTGSNSFEFNPAAANLAGAVGYLKADGGGNAYLSERLQTGAGAAHLLAQNAYLLGFTGAGVLASRPQPNLINMGITARPMVFAGAQIGAEGELTLEHGLFVGLPVAIANPGPAPWVSAMNVTPALGPAVPGGLLTPGLLVSIAGSGLAAKQEVAPGVTWPVQFAKLAQPVKLPAELGGVSVTLGGVACPLVMVSEGQLVFQVPLGAKPGAAPLQVTTGGKKSSPIDVTIARSAPVAAAPPAPFKKGEPVTLLVNGLGAETAVQLYVDGHEIKQRQVTPYPLWEGFSQVKFAWPADRGNRALPVAVLAGGVFADLLEITPRP
jgi:uncharacterized protein (TIGR03437 family)